MRFILCVLFAGGAWAAESRSAVVVFSPVVVGKVAPGLQFAMQEKATAMLMSTGRYDLVHLRQVRSMALHHRMSLDEFAEANSARKAAERLGVVYFVYSKLIPTKTGFSLDVSVGQRASPKVESMSLSLPKKEAAAVKVAANALVQGLAKFDGTTAPSEDLEPRTSNDAAMRAYADCDSRLMVQPVGIENPFVLQEAELDKAIAECGRAVKADAKFSAAWGALAFATALKGNDAKAVEALTTANAKKNGHNPHAMLARFWLVSRYQSSEAAVGVLKDAVAQESGFLLARAYLAELYNALGNHLEAANAWREYSARSEGNAFIISRLAYTLARLGKTKDAADIAAKAMAYDPESFELALEYGSRLIDNNQTPAAIRLLTPMANQKDAPAELVLRLGYAQLLQNELTEAEKLNLKALAKAKDPAEWRTRARAKINLADIAMRREDVKEAKAQVSDALKEGLRAANIAPSLRDLLTAAEIESAEAKGVGKRQRKERSAVPETKGATPPKGFDAVKQ